jgi:hypothetical protein
MAAVSPRFSTGFVPAERSDVVIQVFPFETTAITSFPANNPCTVFSKSGTDSQQHPV